MWYTDWKYVAINPLAILDEDVVFHHLSNGNCTPVILRRVLPSERTASVPSRSITVTNRSSTLTYIVASCLVCTSPLAVITVVGFFDILKVSSSAELRSLVTDHMHTSSGIHHKLSFLGRLNPLLNKRVKCSLVLVRFELVHILGKIPKPLLRAHRCCLSASSWRPVLKFHSVETSLIRNFGLYFSKRWSFVVSDVCLTQRRVRETCLM